MTSDLSGQSVIIPSKKTANRAFSRLLATTIFPITAAAGLGMMPAAARGQNIFVADPTGNIGEYTASGGTVNASLITGLNSPRDIAISGSDVFVTNTGNDTIGEYTTSGATVNASLITGLSNGPFAIAISGSNIFESNNGSAYTIGEYTTSGATVNSSLITGLGNPAGMAISGSDIFVANYNAGTIGEYTTSGATVNASLITGLSNPIGIAISGSDIFEANIGSGTIGEYTTAGATVNASLLTGLNSPMAIAVTSIPEPSTYAAVLGLASIGFVLIRRRRAAPAPAC